MTNTFNKAELIEELWQKHCYKINENIYSDRSKISDDYYERTGEHLSSSTISNYTGKLDKERLFNEKNGDYSIETAMVKHNIDDNGNITSQIKQRMSRKQVFTNAELLELHGISKEENRIKQIVSNEWTMTNSDGEQFFNFQSKIIAAPILEGGLSIEQFQEMLENRPVKPFKIKQIGVGKRNLVIGLADIHFPMDEDYASELLSEMFEIIENGYDTIVIEQLGDLFESSQMKDTITLKGTVLPTVDMVEAIHQAENFFDQTIEKSLEHANTVNIEHACGNHSGNMEYMFIRGLKRLYKRINEPRLNINLHNDYRVAYKIGNVGIMMSHGDTVPLKRLPGIFANEYAVLWGTCESHEVHTGHKHNKFTEQEVDGVVMRQFPTPKKESKLHSEYTERGGYISRKMIQLIEYNEDHSKVIYEIG